MITQFLSSIKNLFKKLGADKVYISALEQYIISHNPKDTIDIERLTKEFNLRKTQR
jgi:hypothetical protein